MDISSRRGNLGGDNMNPRNGYLLTIALGLFMLVLMLPIQIVYPMKETIIESPIEYKYNPRPEQVVTYTFVRIQTLKDKVLETAQIFANNHEYIIHKYDCTEFSRDLKRLLMKEYHEEGIKVEEIIQQVNCSYDYYWNKDMCEQFNGWHEFIKVKLPEYEEFYVEATIGWEIHKLDYPVYNLEVKE